MSTFDINQVRAMLAKVNWERRRSVAVLRGYRAFTHDSLPLGHFYVDHTQKLVVMSVDAFQALSLHSTMLIAVVGKLIDNQDGLLFINMHVPPFDELLRARAAEAGSETTKPYDTIHDLQVRTQWLMNKAQSLRHGQATVGEIELFIGECSQLGTEVRHVAEGVRRLEAMLELATDLVFAA